jgi:hypothetical protein
VVGRVFRRCSTLRWTSRKMQYTQTGRADQAGKTALCDLASLRLCFARRAVLRLVDVENAIYAMREGGNPNSANKGKATLSNLVLLHLRLAKGPRRCKRGPGS